MVSLGILVTNLLQEEAYFCAIAKASLTNCAKIYLFLPSDTDLIRKIAKGKSYCQITNTWKDATFPLPTFIYDRCFYEDEAVYRKHFPFVTWLKSQPNIYFLGHGLPNKWIVHNLLNNDPIISFFLPNTKILTNSTEVFSMLARHSTILLKPVSGSQGKGIFILAHKNKIITLTTKKNGKTYNKQLTKMEVKQLIYKVLKQRKYLLQPFLQLTNNEQRPFDIRIFLQKNKDGKWTEIGRGIRTGKIGDYTSNLSSGGEVACYKDWLDLLPIDAWQPLQHNLSTLIKRIPTTLEREGYKLFEIGLDFGFDTNGKLWLLEVNSKPGRKVVTTNFPEMNDVLAKAPILYCLYLDAKRKGVGV